MNLDQVRVGWRDPGGLGVGRGLRRVEPAAIASIRPAGSPPGRSGPVQGRCGAISPAASRSPISRYSALAGSSTSGISARRLTPAAPGWSTSPVGRTQATCRFSESSGSTSRPAGRWPRSSTSPTVIAWRSVTDPWAPWAPSSGSWVTSKSGRDTSRTPGISRSGGRASAATSSVLATSGEPSSASPPGVAVAGSSSSSRRLTAAQGQGADGVEQVARAADAHARRPPATRHQGLPPVGRAYPPQPGRHPPAQLGVPERQPPGRQLPLRAVGKPGTVGPTRPLRAAVAGEPARPAAWPRHRLGPAPPRRRPARRSAASRTRPATPRAGIPPATGQATTGRQRPRQPPQTSSPSLIPPMARQHGSTDIEPARAPPGSGRARAPPGRVSRASGLRRPTASTRPAPGREQLGTRVHHRLGLKCR